MISLDAKPVQHDNKKLSSALCHPEPGPEASNVILIYFRIGSFDFGILVWNRWLARVFPISNEFLSIMVKRVKSRRENLVLGSSVRHYILGVSFIAIKVALEGNPLYAVDAALCDWCSASFFFQYQRDKTFLKQFACRDWIHIVILATVGVSGLVSSRPTDSSIPQPSILDGSCDQPNPDYGGCSFLS